MSLQKIVREFIKTISKNKNIISVIQVGSSLWDVKSKDIDLVIVTKGYFPSSNDLIFLERVKKKFTKRYGITFGGGGLFSKIRKLNIDIIFLPEKFDVMYAFKPLLYYGMSLSPYKILYGVDFFKQIRKKLRKPSERDILFKFGPFTNFYLSCMLDFSRFVSKYQIALSITKIILYSLVFMKGKYVKKTELIPFLKKNYDFFNKLCEKYKIDDEIFYKKLSKKELLNLYEFLKELLIILYKNFK